jgi:hypothetical protein
VQISHNTTPYEYMSADDVHLAFKITSGAHQLHVPPACIDVRYSWDVGRIFDKPTSDTLARYEPVYRDGDRDGDTHGAPVSDAAPPAGLVGEAAGGSRFDSRKRMLELFRSRWTTRFFSWR